MSAFHTYLFLAIIMGLIAMICGGILAIIFRNEVHSRFDLIGGLTISLGAGFFWYTCQELVFTISIWIGCMLGFALVRLPVHLTIYLRRTSS